MDVGTLLAQWVPGLYWCCPHIRALQIVGLTVIPVGSRAFEQAWASTVAYWYRWVLNIPLWVD